MALHSFWPSRSVCMRLANVIAHHSCTLASGTGIRESVHTACAVCALLTHRTAVTTRTRRGLRQRLTWEGGRSPKR